MGTHQSTLASPPPWLVAAQREIGRYVFPERRESDTEAMARRAGYLTAMARFARALVEVAGRLEAMGPSQSFARPSTLPVDDGVLRWHLVRAATRRATAKDRQIASDFYPWRDACLEAVERDTGNVETLIGLGVDALDAPVEAGAADHGRALLLFVEEQWRTKLPRPAPRTWGEQRDLAKRIARNVCPAPYWLLWSWTQAPAGVRVRPPDDEVVADFGDEANEGLLR